MSTLTTRDLGVRRGGTRVVWGLDLSVGPGAVFWVVGPNGAGKTSLLRVLAGLDRPEIGRVRWRARPGAPFRYLHSEMALPGWSAVGALDRLVAGLVPGVSRPTPLRPLLAPGRWVRRLSTGERKRLLLDVLLRIPGSLLLDEPYAHLSQDAGCVLSGLLRIRARTDVVIVVTNQASQRRTNEPGIMIQGGAVEPLGSVLPTGHPRPAGNAPPI